MSSFENVAFKILAQHRLGEMGMATTSFQGAPGYWVSSLCLIIQGVVCDYETKNEEFQESFRSSSVPQSKNRSILTLGKAPTAEFQTISERTGNK